MWDFYIQGDATDEELENHYHATLHFVEDLEFRNTFTGMVQKL